MALPSSVKIVDVGPRDGLQNEPGRVSVDVKIELCNRLVRAGVRTIEVGAFVSPTWVPQMADTDAVMKQIERRAGASYSVLVPNMRGFEAALEAKATEICVFAAASEAFSQKNINCSIAESIERFRPVVAAARANAIRVRGDISCALGCPYQGEVSPESVADVVQQLADLGCDEIAIADTIGVGTPSRTRNVIDAATRHLPIDRLAGHFHDTYGQALANIYASLEYGIHIFDASVAGLGGCPYAKGATGNVATEDVVYMFNGLGIDTGIDLVQLARAGEFISQSLNRANVSRAGRALLATLHDA